MIFNSLENNVIFCAYAHGYSFFFVLFCGEAEQAVPEAEFKRGRVLDCAIQRSGITISLRLAMQTND